ncbi:class I SAM-dependent methyltransferase [Angustibacter sp. McL0619]|uniref:class I SAM-dependent methyltransferase n=1 Tax=Angustibacter sp. McL0619 TaxID=3415676 RepID=UPI003CF69CDD
MTRVDPWVSGKQTHRRLSDAVATGRQDYAATRPGTAAYLRAETAMLDRLTLALDRRQLALDLGCGSGRVTMRLASRFAEVRGYDMSARMLERAAGERGSAEHVRLVRRDLDERLLDDVPDGAADLVVAAFGMVSFLRDPVRLLTELDRVLAPAGRALLSFYNARSLVAALTPTGLHPVGLGAVAGPQPDLLEVEYDGDEYHVPARAYLSDEVRALCSPMFRCELRSFPTVSGWLSDDAATDTQAICGAVDDALGGRGGPLVGSYLVASLSRPRRLRLALSP